MYILRGRRFDVQPRVGARQPPTGSPRHTTRSGTPPDGIRRQEWEANNFPEK